MVRHAITPHDAAEPHGRRPRRVAARARARDGAAGRRPHRRHRCAGRPRDGAGVGARRGRVGAGCAPATDDVEVDGRNDVFERAGWSAIVGPRQRLRAARATCGPRSCGARRDRATASRRHRPGDGRRGGARRRPDPAPGPHLRARGRADRGGDAEPARRLVVVPAPPPRARGALPLPLRARRAASACTSPTTSAADAARVVRDGSIERITDGYHPVVAAPAAAMYYLWALAGDHDTVDTRIDPRTPDPPHEPRFLTPVSGCRESRARRCFHPGGRMTTTDLPATDLPETMPAAVLKGLRHVDVEDRPLPTLGPRRGAARGQPLRHLRLRPPLHGRVGGRGEAGRDRGPRVQRHRRRARERRRRAGRSARRSSAARRRAAACASTASTGRPSLCAERGKVGAGESEWQGAFAGYKAVNADEMLRVPDGLSMRHAALVEPMAVALHGITRSGGARPGARVPRHRRRPDRVPVGRRAEGRGRQRHRRERAARGPPRRCARGSARAPSTRRSSTSPMMPHDLVAEPFDVVLECSGNRDAMEAGPRAAEARAARSCSSARGCAGRGSTPTASCSTSS